MKQENYKVPFAVLGCFLIAFILQGVLKLCGIFVFEKALEWRVFGIIDNTLWMQIIYYSIIVFMTIWFLSFSLTTKPYSTKWYHYVIIGVVSIANTVIKLFVTISFSGHILFDILMYIIVPVVINITTNKEDKFLDRSLFGIVVTITTQIALYFAYLGLSYWSHLLTSLIPTMPTVYPASTNFLIQLEVYFGLVFTMISLNMLTKRVKGGHMDIPINIASKEAKLKAKKEKLLKAIAKIDAELDKIKK